MYYPGDEGTTTYYTSIENDTNISYKNNFGLEFNSEYSIIWSGYVKLDVTGEYSFWFNHTDTFELSIGESCKVFMGICRNKIAEGYKAYMDKGIYPYLVGYSNNYYEPFFETFSTFNDEIIPLKIYRGIKLSYNI